MTDTIPAPQDTETELSDTGRVRAGDVSLVAELACKVDDLETTIRGGLAHVIGAMQGFEVKLATEPAWAARLYNITLENVELTKALRLEVDSLRLRVERLESNCRHEHGSLLGQ